MGKLYIMNEPPANPFVPIREAREEVWARSGWRDISGSNGYSQRAGNSREC